MYSAQVLYLQTLAFWVQCVCVCVVLRESVVSEYSVCVERVSCVWLNLSLLCVCVCVCVCFERVSCVWLSVTSWTFPNHPESLPQGVPWPLPLNSLPDAQHSILWGRAVRGLVARAMRGSWCQLSCDPQLRSWTHWALIKSVSYLLFYCIPLCFTLMWGKLV